MWTSACAQLARSAIPYAISQIGASWVAATPLVAM